jgi:hypothetical protein
MGRIIRRPTHFLIHPLPSSFICVHLWQKPPQQIQNSTFKIQDRAQMNPIRSEKSLIKATGPLLPRMNTDKTGWTG